MKIHKLILATFFLLTIAGNVDAASFDCGKAASEVAKIMCSDPLLSKSDDYLAALYDKILKQGADPVSLKKQQIEGLRNVRNSCIDAACLRDAYTTRTSQLLSVEKVKSPGEPKAIISDAEACQIVVDHANRGTLGSLDAPLPATQPTKKELEGIFGEDTLYGGISYWSLDLDNDGIPDHLVISVQGTASVSQGYVVSGKKGSAVHEVGDDGYDLSVLEVSGRYYVLSHYGDRMGKLWRLSKGGEFLPVCKFTPREKPETALVVGKENAVCSEASLDRVHHVRYALMHTLGPLPLDDRFLPEDPIDGLAQVDVDNDGTPDNVVRIDFTRLGGRGCSGRYIAVTDDTRSKIPDTKLNALLNGKAVCDSKMDVFVHEGIAYVDVQDDSGNRQIYRITGDKAETICEFRGRLIHDVVDVQELEE